MRNTTLKLSSNIMLKSKCPVDCTKYLPYDLMPIAYKDSRCRDMLTEYQQLQQDKSKFMAKYIKSEK